MRHAGVETDGDAGTPGQRAAGEWRYCGRRRTCRELVDKVLGAEGAYDAEFVSESRRPHASVVVDEDTPALPHSGWQRSGPRICRRRRIEIGRVGCVIRVESAFLGRYKEEIAVEREVADVALLQQQRGKSPLWLPGGEVEIDVLDGGAGRRLE